MRVCEKERVINYANIFLVNRRLTTERNKLMRRYIVIQRNEEALKLINTHAHRENGAASVWPLSSLSLSV